MSRIKQLEIGGRSILWRPAHEPDSHKGSLLLLHGYGADEHDLMGLANYFDANIQIFSIRAPGVTPFGGASWFDIEMSADGSLKFNYEQAIESSRRIIELVSELQHEELIPEEKVVLGGFSQGATIANLVTLQKPQAIKALLIMSGRLQSAASDLISSDAQLTDLAIFAGHGTMDNVIPIQFGREIVKFWEALPVQLQSREYPMGHEISLEELNDIQSWLKSILNL